MGMFYNSPERSAMMRAENFEREAELKKYLAELQYGKGGAYDRHNVSQEEIARMHYGTGGAADRGNIAQERIAGMQYGPGGAVDRGITALAPLRSAEVLKFGAEAGELGSRGKLYEAQAASAMEDLPYMRKLNEKLFGDKKTGVARPKPAISPEPSFWDIDTAMSEEQNKWSPTGVGALDWAARRGRNIVSALPRAMGGIPYWLSQSRFWGG